MWIPKFAASLLLAVAVPAFGVKLSPELERPRNLSLQQEQRKLVEDRKLAEHQTFVERQKLRAQKKLQEKREREQRRQLEEQRRLQEENEAAHRKIEEREAAAERHKKEAEKKLQEKKEKEEQRQEELQRKLEQVAEEEKNHIKKQKSLWEKFEDHHQRDKASKDKETQEDFEKSLSVARAACEKIAHVYPQRTAGTTLAQIILPRMTSVNNQTQVNKYNMEYRWALALAPNCIVASLRDPVERFMSEYSFFKANPGALEQDSWDVPTHDLPWLNRVKSRPIADGLQEYLSSPTNPALNRQARYLLGFERVQCAERCCGVCSHGEPGYPAYAYDFKAQYDELLARAKHQLQSLRAFTVAECLPESTRALAAAVGWQPDEAEELARQYHLGVRGNTTWLGDLSAALGTTDALKKSTSTARGNIAWSAVLPPKTVAAIRDKNRLDVELLKYAKQLLYERHGIKCEH